MQFFFLFDLIAEKFYILLFKPSRDALIFYNYLINWHQYAQVGEKHGEYRFKSTLRHLMAWIFLL